MGLLFGMAAGLALNLGYLWRTFQVTLPPLSLLRAALAFAAVLGLGRVWPAAGTPGLLGGKVGTLLCAGLASTLYVGLLMVMGELRIGELLQLRRERPAGAAAPPA